jgi:hypothetical protein
VEEEQKLEDNIKMSLRETSSEDANWLRIGPLVFFSINCDEP